MLAAARDDDPLAFGPDRLRQAYATYAAGCQNLTRSLPPDRSTALRQAEAELHRRKDALRHAERDPAPTSRRPWIRAVGAAAANEEVATAREVVEAAAGIVRQERASVGAGIRARKEADPLRRELAGALETLSAALPSLEPPAHARAHGRQRRLERDLGIDLDL